MGGGVTWEAVRLLSHGLCLQADLTEGGVSGRSLWKKKHSTAAFHVGPQQVEAVKRIDGELLTQQPAMEIPAINLKVS